MITIIFIPLCTWFLNEMVIWTEAVQMHSFDSNQWTAEHPWIPQFWSTKGKWGSPCVRLCIGTRQQLLVRPADWKIPRKKQTSVGPFASRSSVVRCSRLLVRSCSRLFVRQLGIPSRWLSHTEAPEHRWQEIKIKRSTRIRSNPFVVLVLRLLTILTLALTRQILIRE